MAEDALFYVGQKALIAKGKDVLVLTDPKFGIDLPGGKIQVGESDFKNALYREIEEETGLEVTLGHAFDTGYFEFPTNIKHKNAGKKIYLVFFHAMCQSGKVRISEEHTDYKWINKSNYNTFLKDFKSDDVIVQVLKKYFRNNY